MRSSDLQAALRRQVGRRRDLVWQEFDLEHRAGHWTLLRIASREIGPHDRVVLLRAGVHGDETAGPLLLARNLGRLADRALDRGLKLVVYPLANPSGFDAGTRYNADGDRGHCGNNAFLYYRRPDGKMDDDLGRGRAFQRWYWASDRRLRRRLPAETALLHRRLQLDPLRQVVAALDLHQDHLSPIAAPAAYHYAFGDLTRYRTVLKRLRPLLPLLRRRVIAAGQRSGMRTDDHGFLVRHDGTLGDLLHRLGTTHAVTTETAGGTPPALARRVGRIWSEELIDLAAAPAAAGRRSFAAEVRRRLKASEGLYRVTRTGPLPVVIARQAPPEAPWILLTAGLHGDEPAGVLAVLEFLERDLPRHAGRFRFLVLPCLNPSGFERGLRHGAGGVDINRHFGDQGTAPEARLVKQVLARHPGPYALALDLHETDTYLPPGGGFGVEDNPDRFYLYEQGRARGARLGRRILDSLRREGVPISSRRTIYGARCVRGLISTPAPGQADYPDLPEFVGTLDWYLLGRGLTDRFLATETPTAWPLRRRVAVQRRVIRLALGGLEKTAATGRPSARPAR